jgi:hypothetical protein
LYQLGKKLQSQSKKVKVKNLYKVDVEVDVDVDVDVDSVVFPTAQISCTEYLRTVWVTKAADSLPAE